MLEHGATREYLSNDLINYVNQFGKEYEVSCKKNAVASKPQQLGMEQLGKQVIDLTQKKCSDCNIW